MIIQAIKTEATGQYSRKAFERLGFEAFSEILYSEYEVDGEKIFDPIKSHRGTTFMIKCNNEVGRYDFLKEIDQNIVIYLQFQRQFTEEMKV